MSIIQGGLVIEGVQPGALRFTGAPVAAVNEVQTATQSGTWTSGTFVASIFGQSTAPLAYNATGAQVAAALNLLGAVGASGFGGTGAAGGPFVLTASGGAVSGRDIPPIAYDTTNIVGGGTIANVESTKGVQPTGYGSLPGTILVRADTGVAYSNVGTAAAPVLTKISGT